MAIKDTNKEKEIIYDFSGCRVEKPSNGLYIKNGKKCIVKSPL